MVAVVNTNGQAVRNRSVILLARMVDARGVPIRPADVTTMEYSVYELDGWQPGCFTPIAGHERAALRVAEVLFDSLQLDKAWTVDGEGYNFRHAINLDFGRKGRFPAAGADCEVRYRITPAIGGKTNVRFHLRGVCND